MPNVTITVRKNGPYLVSGAVEVRDADGNLYPAKEAVALRRCGASTKKPFRGGTHPKLGFQAAEDAAPGSVEKWGAAEARGTVAHGAADPA